ncbi:PTS sugar transporter [Klugiella xanthotipulae]|uniref:Cellobiose-specific phosphotransferase system component IIB n=1 Tax=Klugiella xanthotipulae TaxID=244735 RepID=A0A543I5D3_9MICO|nr:PTS sugar transporter [Klugiella xanthotipulae]TQM65751.1 cellobiose-specific phosphotransferase system component IIB [Klugiella xanthotipulae]
MRNITVVCGAGVSSTFLAHRIEASIRATGDAVRVHVSALSGLAAQCDGDVVLLGPHLSEQRDAVAVTHPLAAVGVVPEDVLRTLDGAAAVALARSVLAAHTPGRPVTRETSYGPSQSSILPTDSSTPRRPSHG